VARENACFFDFRTGTHCKATRGQRMNNRRRRSQYIDDDGQAAC
jgi:hypothetical protein